MSQTITRTNLLNRIGAFFRRPDREGNIAPTDQMDLSGESRDLASGGVSALIEIDERSRHGGSGGEPPEPRVTFLRPWVKRDQAIEQLQNGVAALTELMGAIRENLIRDSARQDELLNTLQRFQAIESLPESSRVQGEALKAIQAGIEQQNVHQGRFSELFERMHQSDALVLENLRENISRRDGDLEQSIRRQNTRVTMMLTAGILISLAALTAIVVFGIASYGAMSRLH